MEEPTKQGLLLVICILGLFSIFSGCEMTMNYHQMKTTTAAIDAGCSQQQTIGRTGVIWVCE